MFLKEQFIQKFEFRWFFTFGFSFLFIAYYLMIGKHVFLCSSFVIYIILLIIKFIIENLNETLLTLIQEENRNLDTNEQDNYAFTLPESQGPKEIIKQMKFPEFRIWKHITIFFIVSFLITIFLPEIPIKIWLLIPTILIIVGFIFGEDLLLLIKYKQIPFFSKKNKQKQNLNKQIFNRQNSNIQNFNNSNLDLSDQNISDSPDSVPPTNITTITINPNSQNLSQNQNNFQHQFFSVEKKVLEKNDFSRKRK
ncbi:protein rer1 [Anaeramoeba ignava]|uniref:Protein rer1 n=1 Tax=Anaeramoeba ignava TaxID=1746090 RepID=A0A9Q0LH71_ANAIG|nr:protein rer1 [Anaeramoeba ignava]